MIIQVRYDARRDIYGIEVEHDDRYLIMPVSSEKIYRTDPKTLNRDISEQIANAFGVEPQDIRYALSYLVEWIPRRDAPSEWEYQTGVSVPVSCRYVEERRKFTQEDYRDAQVSWTDLARSLHTETLSFNGFFDPSMLGYDMPQGITKEQKGEADQRAKELLLEHMSEEQKQQFGDGSCPFICVGNITGTRYKLYPVRQGGILTISKFGKRVDHYCLVQSGLVPLCDQLLAQKMLIENDEARFLRIANKP